MPAKKTRAPLVTSTAEDELLVHTYTLPQLLEGARRRSRAHVGQLQRKYGPSLVGQIQRHDATVTAEGVLSEVFMRLPDALARYEEREKFEAFLWTIAKGILIDRQRRHRRQAEVVLADGAVVKRGLSARRQFEQRDLVGRLAAGLTPRRRNVWLRHLAGYSNQDTAAALNMTPGAVAAALSHAWDAVREHAASMNLRRSDILNSGLTAEGLRLSD